MKPERQPAVLLITFLFFFFSSSSLIVCFVFDDSHSTNCGFNKKKEKKTHLQVALIITIIKKAQNRVTHYALITGPFKLKKKKKHKTIPQNAQS